MIVIRLCCFQPTYLSQPSLLCDFCPSDQRFAYSFLQIPPRDGHPCCSAIHFPLSGRVRDLHPLERAHGAQTEKRAPSRMPVLSLSEVDIPADRIGIPSMRNPPPARVLPDESRFLAVEIIAVVAHTAPPGKLPSAANQVERFRWQHTPAPRTALLCWQHPFPKPPPRHPSAHGQAIPLEAVSSLFSRRARRAARTRHTTTLRQSRQSTNRVRPLRKGSHRT